MVVVAVVEVQRGQVFFFWWASFVIPLVGVYNLLCFGERERKGRREGGRLRVTTTTTNIVPGLGLGLGTLGYEDTTTDEYYSLVVVVEFRLTRALWVDLRGRNKPATRHGT
jgi:hypothetical protein